ncbi:MAG: hypothetical protein RR657_05045 [Peptostreptococcaceae bacterium]
MAEFGGFFNSVGGDRRYKSEDFAKFFKTFMTTGINPNKDSLSVYKKSNSQIEIKPGSANVEGYLYLNDSNLIKTITTGVNRIDRVILKLDIVNRTLSVVIKEGTQASAPELTRNNSVYELSLAKVTITGNDFTIVDERGHSNLCTFMQFTGIADIQKMWDDYLSMVSDLNSVWRDWFTNMQGQSIRGIYIQGENPTSSKVGDIWIQTQ